MIAAGGTGGHIFPGVAIAQAIKRCDPAVEIDFVGSSRGLEGGIIPRLGWRLFTVDAKSWKDRGFLGKAFVMLMMPIMIFKAVLLLRRVRTDLLISLGGYASVPVIVASWFLRIVIFLVEPNAIAGFTNRKLSLFATKVFISYQSAINYFNKDKIVNSGVPLREDIVLQSNGAVQRHTNKFSVLCFGGAQGAVSLNRSLLQSLPFLNGMSGRIRFFHMVGSNDDMKAAEEIYKKYGFEAVVVKWWDEMWKLYASADLLISRSGAITLAEASLFGLPMILVPYQWAADDHQRANARHFEESGAAVVIENKDLTGDKLASVVRRLVDSQELLKEMSSASKRLARPDAADVVAREAMKYLHRSNHVWTL